MGLPRWGPRSRRGPGVSRAAGRAGRRRRCSLGAGAGAPPKWRRGLLEFPRAGRPDGEPACGAGARTPAQLPTQRKRHLGATAHARHAATSRSGQRARRRARRRSQQLLSDRPPLTFPSPPPLCSRAGHGRRGRRDVGRGRPDVDDGPLPARTHHGELGRTFLAVSSSDPCKPSPNQTPEPTCLQPPFRPCSWATSRC